MNHLFMGYINKVLPTVYSECLSYYESICKIANKLNEVITQTNKNTGDISTIKTQLEEIKHMTENEMQIIENIIAKQYDVSKVYYLGDYIIKDNILYKCTAESTTGDFNSDHWETAPEVMKIINDGFNGLSDNLHSLSVNTDIALQRIDNDISGLQTEQLAMTTDIANNREFISTVAGRTTNLADDINSINSTINNINAQISQINTDISGLSSHLLDVTHSMALIIEEVNNNKTAITTIQTDISGINTRLNGVDISLSTLDENVTKAIINVAPKYISNNTYFIGDYCIYNNILYICNTDFTSGTFDGNKWDRTDVSEQLIQLKLWKNETNSELYSIMSSIANEYNIESTYNVGDIVMYNYLLYKCTTAVTIPELFDETKWTRTTVIENL